MVELLILAYELNFNITKMFPIPTLKQIDELEDTCIYYGSQEALKQ